MRKFYFENEKGERVDLNGALFLHIPTGLGSANTNTYESLQNGFYACVSNTASQTNIVGEIVMATHHYSRYSELIDWLNAGKELYLIYKPLDTEYYITVKLEYIQKSEITSTHMLYCPISFQALTPWHTRTPRRFVFERGTIASNTKKYTYAYPYRYTAFSSVDSIDITATGHIPAAIVIQITGPLLNPVFRLIDKYTRAEYGKLDLSAITIADGEYLEYSSVPGDCKIVKIDADGIETDVSQYVNIADNNFFLLPVGVPCELTLDATGDGDVTADVREFYRSV